MLHWSAEELGDRAGLGRTLGRERGKDTTLDYGSSFAERRGLHPLAPASEIVLRREPERVAERLAPLLPAHVDAWGRDSLGRGTGAADLAAVAGTDDRVRQAASKRWHLLYDAYRDGEAAVARFEATLRAAGGDLRAVAARLRQEGLEALGKLRGRDGIFMTQFGRDERARAVGAIRALGWNLEGEAKDRERTVHEHVGVVEGQRRRDAVEVPGLSQAAWGAVRAVEASRETGGGPERPGEEHWQRFARERAAVANAWAREVVAKPAVAAELRAFGEAAERRLGYDVEAVLRRAEAARGALLEGEQPRAGLAGVARALSAERAGQGAHTDRERAIERQREAEGERLGLQRGRGMRM